MVDFAGIDRGFKTAIYCQLMWIPWCIMPLSFVFFVHHKTYKTELKSRMNSMIDELAKPKDK